ncbi:uncharacterized protein LOC129743045 [Uranotaenia lowii]|uniref:uncharacterized protein LOC129743045 n=1 Tax=Uranotaenia lowii TaxID=190385 RepID=UPI002478F25E|nr:uncharacterized protein LOC129743045 [Uranotaenia lowii]
MFDDKKLKSRKLKRANIIAGINRMEQFLHQYVEDQHQGEVRYRLERLEKLWESFDEVQADCEELVEEEDAGTKNLEIRSKTESIYFRVKAGLASKIPESFGPTASTSYAANETSAPAHLANIKLPTITLPEFDGDFNQWLTFHDTFVSMIHSSTEISCVQKFHYLRAALKGEAANLIQSITITANNYSVAWEALVTRYSNTTLLRKKHIRALLKYPKIPNNSVDALHRIVDEFQRHTKILEQLGEPVIYFSSILMELLEDKLDDASLTAWEESIAGDPHPTYNNMIEFLQKRTRIMETIMINRPTSSQTKPVAQNFPQRKPGPRLSSNAVSEGYPKSYPMCPACEKERHSIYNCPVFNSLDPKGRTKIVTEKKLCANCFRSDHFARSCPSKFSCKHCSMRHHSMIHFGQAESTRAAADPPSRPENVNSLAVAITPQPTVSSNPVVRSSRESVLLPTVVLIVVDAYGHQHIARALLDTGSQPNVISERLCQQLRLSRKLVNIDVRGVDGTATSAKFEIQAEIRSRVSDFSEMLDFLVFRKVTSDAPAIPFSVAQWKIPKNLALADPDFGTPRKIDMIIGAANFYAYLKPGRLQLAADGPLLAETVFGWLATGKFNMKAEQAKQKSMATGHMATVVPVEELLSRFWKIEDVGGSDYSIDEQNCENYYRYTTDRDSSGRYIVRVPKHPEFEQMVGESKGAALRRFAWLERRLEKDADLKSQYHDFMREYIDLGHMDLVPPESENVKSCYLPHHPVVKESSSTTKVRVVFDGSAKTSTGHSLNDSLLVGPVVQDELLTIIIRFRKYPIALVADIAKMYRQIVVHPSDRCFQRILWRFNPDEPVRSYELRTVTYGLAPSSFLATRTLLQLVEDEGRQFPNASAAVRKSVYVDDLIAGASSVEAAVALRTELDQLMLRGGFCFRKWCSNSLKVLADVPSELLGTQSSLKFDPEETIKTLGICWEPEADIFRFDVNVSPSDQPPTKRSILSAIAKLYDPLGLIAPVVIEAKILMQHIWLLGLDWDEEVTPELRIKWTDFCQQLPHLLELRIDRFALAHQFCDAQLHCFVNASEAAYGACIYARSEAPDGTVQVHLLASKSKVAPLSPISIPRLELCAALLGSRLYTRIIASLDVEFSSCFFWSDSMVVLQWMKSPPRTWKTFVANRIAEIQHSTQGSQWLHVAGKQNPADIVSRGVSAEQLIQSELWKHGPAWLSDPVSTWPKQSLPAVLPPEEIEQKKTTILSAVIAPPNMFDKFSSYQELLRTVAYCLRFFQQRPSPKASRSRFSARRV